MAIYLAVVRLGQCEICLGQFICPDEETPSKCIHCGSLMWVYGMRTDRTSGAIRQGLNRERKVLNKGVASAKRQEQGKRQWQGFKPKPEEEK